MLSMDDAGPCSDHESSLYHAVLRGLSSCDLCGLVNREDEPVVLSECIRRLRQSLGRAKRRDSTGDAEALRQEI